MSKFQHNQLPEERLAKIRSEIIQQRDDERRNNPAHQQRSIPCFCIENNKHPKWKLSPIDMTPRLYFVNNVKNSNQNNNVKEKNVGDLSPSNLASASTLFDVTSSTVLILNKHKIPSSSSKNNVTLTSKKNDGDMTLRFRIDSANTDRRKTLDKGFFKKGFYSAPRPHHFRDDIHRPVSQLYLYCFFYNCINSSKAFVCTFVELSWGMQSLRLCEFTKGITIDEFHL